MVSTALGLLLAAAALLVIAGASAMSVIVDLRLPQLIVTLAAAALVVWRLRRARTTGRRVVWGAIAAALLIAAFAAGRDLVMAGPVEEVTFQSNGVTLGGSLYLPRGAGPHPAVVLVHGSGTQPRDEYRFYARQYAARGIAALAYDKRGSGVSEGDTAAASYADFAADAAAAVRLLRARADIRPDAVGLWGLSEGEWVAPLAAVSVNPAFLVLISPSAMTPAQQVRHETAVNVRRAGFGEAEAQKAAELYARVSAFERTGEGREALNEALASAAAEPWFDAAEYLQPSVPPYDRVLALSWFPAWKARMDFDALPVLARLECPVLAQIGGSDPKNDGAAALARIETALARGGNTKFTGLVYPDAEHSVVEWRLPGRIPPPWFAAGYLEAQLDWVVKQVGRF